MMKKWKVVGASIVCLFIVAIAIQAILGGGIGLKIDPPEAQVKPDSTITYDITISSYDNDCYDVTIIPCTCNINWFEWTKKRACVAARCQKQISLNVTPSEKGNFKFRVKAVSQRNPRTSAGIVDADIWVRSNGKEPDLIITKVWLVGNTIHYELMNVGNGTVHIGWDNALFVDSHSVARDHMDPPLYPCERRTSNFDHKLICPLGGTKRIKVCADIDNAIKEREDECNNCLEEVLKCNQGVTCIALMPETDKPQPQVNGTVISWTACAFDPDGDKLWYRFLAGKDITDLTVVRDWGTSNKWIWRTDKSNIGDNLICVDVRDGYHENVDRSVCQWYWIN